MLWPQYLPRLISLNRRCVDCSCIQFDAGERPTFDRVLRVFALRQVRCSGCRRRYYWFIRAGAV
jgi:hypothetical protein